MTTYNSLSALFTAIANAIRSKTGGSSIIVANDFPSAIENITSLQVGTSETTITRDSKTIVFDVLGAPLYFGCYVLSGWNTTLTSKRVIDVFSNGDVISGHGIYYSNSKAYLTYYADLGTVTYSAQDQTLTIVATTPLFQSDVVYKLIYFY